jgi:hypothetical protein
VTQGTVAAGPTAAPNFPNIPGCRLIAVAGQGGMGTVYRAEQLSPRRIVAVKVLSQAAASAEKLAAFHREAETIARLEHPNILPVYGYGEAGGRPYLVLRYLAGGSVARLIRQGPIGLANAARWTRAVAGALDFAHAHGLVHRDVKPSNMLLDEAGNAYLTDFGIAAATEATNSAGTIGSAAYMSPEQASGQPADRRSDLYSLAVSLFEMLTGQLPYTAETPLGLIVRHINDPIPSAREINPNIPPAVDALIQRGMAKDPAGRPPNAGEFGRLLEKALAAPNAAGLQTAAPQAQAGAASMAEPPATLVGAEPQTAEPEVAAPARRGTSTLLWVGVGVVALCLIGGFALLGGGAMFALFGAPRATTPPLPTITPISVSTPDVTTATPQGQLLAADFANSLSGFRVSKPDDTGGIARAQGALRFTVLKTGAEWFSPSGHVKALDVKIDVDLQQMSGPALTEFGAICRWQDAKNYTAFAISAGGQYKIWQKINDATLRLIDWTDAPLLAGAGLAPHHLTVICSDTQLSLEVDGVQLGQTDDPGPVPGDVVLFAGLRDAGQLVVDFKKVVVRKP